jgi:Na+-driven multidrug efflux pump
MSILPNHFSVKGGLGFDICRIGLPTAIFSALMSVSTIVLNQILVAYGNDAVAAIGIVFKANMFITFFQMGIANGIQPLLGFNYGSGDKKRFLEIERFTRKCLIISGVICTLIYFIFRYQVVGLFISDENVIARGVPMLVGYMLSGPFIGILFLNMNCMQSVGKPMPATILSILRQGVLLIPLLYLLQAVAGINGVIYGQSITDYIAIILSIIIWKKIQ